MSASPGPGGDSPEDLEPEGAVGSRVGAAAAPEVIGPRSYPALSHMPGLDGLRAVAVVAVVLYHGDVAWMPGGFLGVDLFFVLSGFLITSLLLAEVSTTGRIRFGSFFLRRARRLLPALLAVLTVSGLLAWVVAPDAMARFRDDVPPALVYVLNWSYILGDESYFAQMGRPPLLEHLWSLNIEEQFYLLWPAVLLLAWRSGGPRRVGRIALVGAVLSAAWMALLAVLAGMPYGADASRVYFGTDTRMMGVLVGAALAVVWIPGRQRSGISPGARAVLNTVAVLALAGVVGLFLLVGEYDAWLYRGGLLAVCALAALLTAMASRPSLAFGAILGGAPLRWVGLRSYGLYLWHWPIFAVTRPGVDIPWQGAPALALRLALVVVAAAVSYRFLELPVRQGAIGRALTRQRVLPLAATTASVAAVVLAALVLLPSAGVPGGSARAVATDHSDTGIHTPAVPATQSPTASPPTFSPTPSPVPTQPPTYRSARAYGDSVVLGAAPALQALWPGLVLDAEVSRHIWIVAEHIIRDTNRFEGGLVIVHTGNNGPLEERDVRAMLASLQSAGRVVLVNQSMPRRWMQPNNALFASVVPDYPNVRLADWAALSAGQRDWFGDDRVHVSPTGAQAYADMVRVVAETP